MRFPSAIIAAFLCLCAQSARALPSNLDGDPPLFGNSKHFAWAQNAGWVNAQPFGYTGNGVQVTPLTVSGIAWAQNLGWVSFGSGSPQNGLRYSQQDTSTGVDFGVNMDWQGNLSGYAWSQNAGWINFGWNTNAADSARPRFIAASNTFTGFAWSQNLGWINLGEGWLKTAPGTVTYADSDLDGIPDSYELAQTGNLTTWNNATDADGDGLLDGWEFTYFLALDVSDGSQDSDGDGWSDRVEFNARFNGLFPVNPARADLPAAWPAPPVSSSINPNAKFAWAQNLGWMNFKHDQPGDPAGVVIARTMVRGTAWLQNAGWVNFGNGLPRDGLRYTNTRADDCGVNVDCDLNLSGYAWSQNFGWINFGWASSTNADRPRLVNQQFGGQQFTGFAWAQNAGWINLALLNNLFVQPWADGDGDGLPDQWEFQRVIGLGILDATSDTDGDGLPDAWEFANFRALDITDGSGDFDQDGVSDREEFAANSNPRDPFSLPPPTGSTISGSSFGKFAWAQNAGWVSLRHDRPQSPSGVIVRENFLSGHGWGQNLGWVDFGRGAPTNGIRYGNNATNDFGVNLDSGGNLSGFAWSQNAGWINFGWAAPNHANRARISLTDGKFKGYAWAQNLGWINLDTGLQTIAIQIADADGDGLDDGWERAHFGNLTAANATTDTDGDGQTDLQEFIAGTDPNDAGSRLVITASSVNEGQTQEKLTFTSSASRLYRVLRSPDLTNWSASAAGFQPGASPFTQTTENLPIPAEQQFFRIEARRPPAP